MIHANAHRFGALVLVEMLTIGLVASTVVPAVSQTSGTWTPPVVLSTGGQGWEAAAAIDGNGNSVALWVSSQASTRSGHARNPAPAIGVP
jgi:hypothetical protein